MGISEKPQFRAGIEVSFRNVMDQCALDEESSLQTLGSSQWAALGPIKQGHEPTTWRGGRGQHQDVPPLGMMSFVLVYADNRHHSQNWHHQAGGRGHISSNAMQLMRTALNRARSGPREGSAEATHIHVTWASAKSFAGSRIIARTEERRNDAETCEGLSDHDVEKPNRRDADKDSIAIHSYNYGYIRHSHRKQGTVMRNKAIDGARINRA